MMVVAVNPAAGVARAFPAVIMLNSATTTIAALKQTPQVNPLATSISFLERGFVRLSRKAAPAVAAFRLTVYQPPYR
jgi:hypothetical protein